MQSYVPMAVLLAWLILGERPQGSRVLQLLLALAGVAVVLKKPDMPWPVPESLADYLALMGDTVDNVPGVEKVGPKTAAKWLQEYGSLDGVVANADKIKGAAGENLRRALDWLPATDVPARFDVLLRREAIHDLQGKHGQRLADRRCQGTALWPDRAVMRDTLNAQAIPSPGGGRWHLPNLQRTLGRLGLLERA